MALREGLPLATLDDDVQKAAQWGRRETIRRLIPRVRCQETSGAVVVNRPEFQDPESTGASGQLEQHVVSNRSPDQRPADR